MPSTPLEAQLNSEESPTVTKENFPYREAIGSLQHLSCKTRPDITFAVNYVSRSMENPTVNDVKNVKRILRYLIGTTESGIHFSSQGSSDIMMRYSDADYAGSGAREKMKSTSVNVIFLACGPVIWGSRLQEDVASSTCEAEKKNLCLET